MSSRLLAATAVLSIAAFTGEAAAQAVRSETAAPVEQGRPKLEKGTAPRVGYRSAFEGYRRYSDEPVGSWRQANDTVRQIGGWQEYARESQSPQGTAPSPKPEPEVRPATSAGSHSGHH